MTNSIIYLVFVLPGILLLKKSGSVPNINLQCKNERMNESIVITLNCSSDIAFELCTVEFLHHNRTIDYVSYSKEDECIHLGGICNQTKCACSSDCKSFVWMFTVNSFYVDDHELTSTSLSCRSRVEVKDIRYIADVSVKSFVYGVENFCGLMVDTVSKERGSNLLDSVNIPTYDNISNIPAMKIEWKILIIAGLVIVFGILVMQVVTLVRKNRFDTQQSTQQSNHWYTMSDNESTVLEVSEPNNNTENCKLTVV